MPESTDYIYKLIDQRTSSTHPVRYVGMTRNPEIRLKDHSASVYFEWMFKKKSAWVQEQKEQGFKPAMEIIEAIKGNRDLGRKRELYWIGTYTLEGAQLLNIEVCNLSLVNAKAIRLQKGLDFHEVSALTDIPDYLFKKIEVDPLYRPTIEDLEDIALALKVDLSQIITPKTVLAPKFAIGEHIRWISTQPGNEYQRDATVVKIEHPRSIRIRTAQPVGVRFDYDINPTNLHKVS
jgi:transcriptional regulator with XRE-family HTH domain